MKWGRGMGPNFGQDKFAYGVGDRGGGRAVVAKSGNTGRVNLGKLYFKEHFLKEPCFWHVVTLTDFLPMTTHTQVK